MTKTDVTIVLADPNCVKTSKQQKKAIAGFIENVINTGPRTDAQLKELGIDKSWNKVVKGLTLKVKSVYTKKCKIFLSVEITKKLDQSDAMGFLNAFKPQTKLNMMKLAPANIRHINFQNMGIKQHLKNGMWVSWNWPQGIKE